MKNLRQIREQYDLITEKEENEDRKLTTLVRSGLYDAKKLPALKKALEKPADKMTAQEKRMMVNLLDSLINQVVSDDQVYRKVKHNVHMKEGKDSKESAKESSKNYYSKYDPRFKSGYPTDYDMPAVVILKRKAIRVYPDGQKVALYYSQQLDKYVTIPFSEAQLAMHEEIVLDEGLGGAILKYGAKYADDALKIGRKMLGKTDDAAKAASKGADDVAGAAAKTASKGSRFGKLRKWVKARRVGRALMGAAAGAMSGDGGSGSSSKSQESGGVNHNFTAKAKTSSAWDKKSSDNRVQAKRDEITQRKAYQMEQTVMNTVKNMVEQDIQESTIFFGEKEIKINNTVAKKIMQVHESMNKTNKKKMEKMLNESATSFHKILMFAVRQ